MSKIDKLILKLKSKPKDFTWSNTIKILNHFGYKELTKKGKTGGSRRKFVDEKKNVIIIHEPHPEKTIKPYVVKLLIEHLKL